MAMEKSQVDVNIGDTLVIRNSQLIPKRFVVEFAGIGNIEITLPIGSEFTIVRTGFGVINVNIDDADTPGIHAL